MKSSAAMRWVGGVGRSRARWRGLVLLAAGAAALGAGSLTGGTVPLLGWLLGERVAADLQHLAPYQVALWGLYLVAAVMLPVYHVRPILKYLRGQAGIGDACIRTECIQCLWRVPALLFAVFVAPSVPLFLSIFLDMLGRIGRIAAMTASQRRWSRRGGAGVAPGV